MLQLLHPAVAEKRRVHRPEARPRNREVVVAQPDRYRNRIVHPPRQRVPVKRQLGHSIVRGENARPERRPRNHQENNNKSGVPREFETVQQSDRLRRTLPGFLHPNRGHVVPACSTAAVSIGRYFTPVSQAIPERKMMPDTNKNATCMFV
jgi:hypothetical protein